MQQALTHGFDSWHEVVSGAFVPLDAEKVTRPGQRSFRGSLHSLHLGETVLTEINADPHTVQRTTEMISNGGDGFFKLSLQHSGQGLLIQDGRKVILQPGRLAIYDTSRPYTLTLDQTFSSHILMFPYSELGISTEKVSTLTATALDEGSPLGKNVSDFLHQSLPALATLSKPIAAQLARNSLSLLATVISEILGTGEPPSENHHQEEKRAALIAYLDRNLSNPDLSPAHIAQANFISVRTLHQLFEGTDTTVAALIRNKRLDHCRDELADLSLRQRPVAVVGARWGFPDPAHFSRVFRTRFGIPPGQYRSQSLRV